MKSKRLNSYLEVVFRWREGSLRSYRVCSCCSRSLSYPLQTLQHQQLLAWRRLQNLRSICYSSRSQQGLQQQSHIIYYFHISLIMNYFTARATTTITKLFYFSRFRTGEQGLQHKGTHELMKSMKKNVKKWTKTLKSK